MSEKEPSPTGNPAPRPSLIRVLALLGTLVACGLLGWWLWDRYQAGHSVTGSVAIGTSSEQRPPNPPVIKGQTPKRPEAEFPPLTATPQLCAYPFATVPKRTIEIDAHLAFKTDRSALEELDLARVTDLFSKFGVLIHWIRPNAEPTPEKAERRELSAGDYVQFRTDFGAIPRGNLMVTLAGVIGDGWNEPALNGFRGKTCATSDDCVLGINPALGGIDPKTQKWVDERTLPRDDIILFVDSIRGYANLHKHSKRDVASRTLAHELAHTLNIYHQDGFSANAPNAEFSVESQSRPDGAPLIQLTAGSIAHLLTSDSKFIRPGESPFDWNQGDPDLHFRKCVPNTNPTLEGRSAQPPPPPGTTPIFVPTMTIRSATVSTVVGAALDLEVLLENIGSVPVKIPKDLSDEQTLQIQVTERGSNAQRWKSIFLPNSISERASDITWIDFPPGKTVSVRRRLFGSADGLVFPKPGKYAVRSVLIAQGAVRGASRSLEIEVLPVLGEIDLRSLHILGLTGVSGQGEVDGRMLLALSVGSTLADETEKAKMTEVATRYAGSPLGRTVMDILVDKQKPDVSRRCELRQTGKSSLYRRFERSNSFVDFDFASSRLTSETRAAIAKFVETEARNGMQIVVVGHADVQGDCLRNMRLSERRAKVVKGAVEADVRRAGLQGVVVKVDALGSTAPLVNASTPEAHRLNRQARFHLLDALER